MGFLDSLFGGGGSKTQVVKNEQTVPAWQLPYLQQGLSEAQRIYFGGGLPNMGGVPSMVPGGAQLPTAPQGIMQPAPAIPAGPAAPLVRGGYDRRSTRPEGGGVDGRRGPNAPGTGGLGYARDAAAAAGQPVPATGIMQPAGPATPATPIQSGIYQGPTVGGLSAASRAGINAIAANAGGINPASSVNAYTSALNGNNFGLQDTAAGKSTGFGLADAAAGKYLNANPYLDANIDAATRGITDKFQRSVAPGIESAAASRGRLGSGWDLANRHDARAVVGQQLGDTESGMRMANYQTERGLMTNAQQFLSGQQQTAQQAMMGNRLQAANGLTDTLLDANDSALRGGAALLGAGGMVDSRNDARMQDAAQRYERTAAEPMDRLQRYMAMVSGNMGQSSSQSTPVSRDVAGAGLGGALAGANLGNMIGIGGGWGAGLGGILGILSDEDTKEDRKPVKTSAMLDALDALPVEEWKYKDGMGDGASHFGTMAQTFKKVTGKGDGRSIPIVDALGVITGATQELSRKLKRIEKRAA